MKEFKQLAGQTLVYGLGTMVPRLLNYVILVPYFTRNLFKHAPQEYGKVTELYAYITFLMIVLTYGMETTYFRFVNTESDSKKIFSTIFSSLVLTSIVFLVVILFFSSSIAVTLKYPGEILFIKLVALILAVEAISAIPFAKLRVQNKAKRFALLKFIHICLNILLMLGIYNIVPGLIGNNSYLLNSQGVISSKFIFISNFLASSSILILLLPELRDYSIKKFDFTIIKPILVYGLPLMISGLAGTINETLDRTIYRHVVTDQGKALNELGIYGANYKIGGLLYIFIQMFRYAAEPYFFNKSKDLDSKSQYSQLMNVFVGIVCSMGLFILLFLNYLKYFIGNTYHEGLFIVPFVVLAYIFYGILFNLSVWYKLSNKTQFALIIMSIGATITIVINIIFIPRFAYGASAVAHVLSYFTMVVFSYILGQKYFKIKYNVTRIIGYIVLAAAIYFVSVYIVFNNWLIDILARSALLLIFVIFVAWKEKIIELIISRENESKNSQ